MFFVSNTLQYILWCSFCKIWHHWYKIPPEGCIQKSFPAEKRTPLWNWYLRRKICTRACCSFMDAWMCFCVCRAASKCVRLRRAAAATHTYVWSAMTSHPQFSMQPSASYCKECAQTCCLYKHKYPPQKPQFTENPAKICCERETNASVSMSREICFPWLCDCQKGGNMDRRGEGRSRERLHPFSG
jgi:hypothetical protein